MCLFGPDHDPCVHLMYSEVGPEHGEVCVDYSCREFPGDYACAFCQIGPVVRKCKCPKRSHGPASLPTG